MPPYASQTILQAACLRLLPVSMTYAVHSTNPPYVAAQSSTPADSCLIDILAVVRPEPRLPPGFLPSPNSTPPPAMLARYGSIAQLPSGPSTGLIFTIIASAMMAQPADRHATASPVRPRSANGGGSWTAGSPLRRSVRLPSMACAQNAANARHRW
jgi:hypothetical protein